MTKNGDGGFQEDCKHFFFFGFDAPELILIGI